ncbi:DedA family protein [Methanothermobacter tenebrarum]|uniref:DedA family protein n=1 Tax=Methanothermobacter tenebrarum TaxID=680118 RepID=A0A328PG21_9EURY|nr:DedA family protein [Methanothermobacter tenebrarum]MBC7101291.1 DedA family protein [Methanobacteriales archaeon]NPV64533.1 DedA family protein [Methanobacteriaceae archaeon]RAO78765.1 DedA family protein [Methanothermobacter tenebrarum]
MFSIVEYLSNIVIGFIQETGYFGVFICMVLESACIPLPSEVIMPFSGYVAWKGAMSILGVTFIGALGNLIGSWIAYLVGFYGGRPFLEKYGRYILITEKKLEMAEEWFAKYGHEAVLISRVLPVIRTFISLPAGIAKMDLKRFTIYTFIGSVPWCFALTYIGYNLGPNWSTVESIFHLLDYAVIIGLALLIVYLWRKI